MRHVQNMTREKDVCCIRSRSMLAWARGHRSLFGDVGMGERVQAGDHGSKDASSVDASLGCCESLPWRRRRQ